MSLRALNKLLGSTYTDVQSLSDGIAFIRIVNAKLPGLVDLRKMNACPLNLLEKQNNLNLLSFAFPGANLDVDAISSGDEFEIRRTLKLFFQQEEDLQQLTIPSSLPVESDALTSPSASPSVFIEQSSTDQASHLADLVHDLSSEIQNRKQHLKSSKKHVKQLARQRDELFAELKRIEKSQKTRLLGIFCMKHRRLSDLE
ncbi:hypothetical protein GEMRC1_007503 [Eukaryota sp. GEM-RC1]